MVQWHRKGSSWIRDVVALMILWLSTVVLIGLWPTKGDTTKAVQLSGVVVVVCLLLVLLLYDAIPRMILFALLILLSIVLAAWSNHFVNSTWGGLCVFSAVCIGSSFGVLIKEWWLDRRNRRLGVASSAGDGRGGRGVDAASGTR